MKLFVAVIIVVLMSGCKPASNPSVQETHAWMQSFAADRGAGAAYEGTGCSGKITWFDNDAAYYTFSFSFSDLDSEVCANRNLTTRPTKYVESNCCDD